MDEQQKAEELQRAAGDIDTNSATSLFYQPERFINELKFNSEYQP